MSIPTVHTCSVSGETSAGKHYILQTTEGSELVCPEALFHNGADRRLAAMLVELQKRIGVLEQLLQHDQEQPEPEKAAAPARKTAAKGRR